MKISELAQYLLSRNGQYILTDDLSAINLSITKLWNMLEPEIKNYYHFCPIEKKFNIDTAGVVNYYDFTQDPNNEGYVASTDPMVPTIYGNPPKEITSCIPVNTMTLISTLAVFLSPLSKDVWNPSRLIEPRPFLATYRNPRLYVTEQTRMDVSAIYDPQINYTRDTRNVLTDVEVVGLENDTHYYVLLQILSGRFLKALGMSRRAFTVTDMPVITDAAQLVEEGEREYKEGLEMLQRRHAWYLSIRP